MNDQEKRLTTTSPKPERKQTTWPDVALMAVVGAVIVAVTWLIIQAVN